MKRTGQSSADICVTIFMFSIQGLLDRALVRPRTWGIRFHAASSRNYSQDRRDVAVLCGLPLRTFLAFHAISPFTHSLIRQNTVSLLTLLLIAANMGSGSSTALFWLRPSRQVSFFWFFAI